MYANINGFIVNKNEMGYPTDDQFQGMGFSFNDLVDKATSSIQTSIEKSIPKLTDQLSSSILKSAGITDPNATVTQDAQGNYTITTQGSTQVVPASSVPKWVWYAGGSVITILLGLIIYKMVKK